MRGPSRHVGRRTLAERDGLCLGLTQETFLRNDLIAHQGDCTLIHWHQPAWSEGDNGPTDTDYQAFWNDAVQYHVTAIVNGHDHDYERWKPMNASGVPTATGVTEIVAGTGGWSHSTGRHPNANVVKDDFTDFGVLQLTLHATNASLAFKAVGGSTIDSSTMNCQQPTGASIPTVTGVSPGSGSTLGGTSVVITGTNFTGATVVKFGTVASGSFTVNSASQITASAPAQGAATVDITVTAPGGTSLVNTLADQFTYTTPTAVITAVGTLVTKYGSGLATLAVAPKTLGDVEVVGVMGQALTLKSLSGGGVTTWTKGTQFQGSIGNDVEIWYGTVTSTGASTITFTWSATPTGGIDYAAQEFTAGLGASTVWALDKPGTTNGASSTSVPLPTLAPSGSGELYFGFAVVANTASAGATTGFTYAVTSDSNGVAYDTNVSGSVSPTATQSPAGTSSSAGVLLTASSGAPPPLPTVTGVSPGSGSTLGGTSVVITGTNFTGATIVKFGTVASGSFTVNSASQITASAPAQGAATVDITVTAPGGTSLVNTLTDQFTYNTPPLPTVTGVSPGSGSTLGGTSVVITGTNFTGATIVKFGTVASGSFTVNSASQITASAPAQGAATVDITVTAPGGTSLVNTLTDQFTYNTPPLPTVTGVSPGSGSTLGGTSVVITGTNFTGATIVKFGTVASGSFTVNSASQITASAPAQGAATVDITVTAPGGTSLVNTLTDQFTYTTPTAVITAVGTLVTKYGSGLATLAVAPKTLGDVEVVGVMGQALTLKSLSGGGVTTWTKGTQFQGSVGNDVEIWYGTVTSTGASTITFTWSATPTGGIDYAAQEFTAGLGASTVWALDKPGTTNGASSTSVPFPSLAPSGSGELYFGFAVVANTASAGATTGFTYAVTSDSNGVAYDTNVSGSVSPTATQSPAGTSSSAGVLLTASSGAPPPLPTVTGVSPGIGVHPRGHLGGHHRHQLHRGHGREVRDRRLGELHGQQRLPDHRQRPGPGRRHRGHHGHRPGGHLAREHPD